MGCAQCRFRPPPSEVPKTAKTHQIRSRAMLCSAARNHGRKDVGLPSRLASFSETGSPVKHKNPSWWSPTTLNGTCPYAHDPRSSQQQSSLKPYKVLNFGGTASLL